MLDTREVDIIASHYNVPGTDNVRYKAMLDYINLAFNPSGLEKEPLKGVEIDSLVNRAPSTHYFTNSA